MPRFREGRLATKGQGRAAKGLGTAAKGQGKAAKEAKGRQPKVKERAPQSPVHGSEDTRCLSDRGTTADAMALKRFRINQRDDMQVS